MYIYVFSNHHSLLKRMSLDIIGYLSIKTQIIQHVFWISQYCINTWFSIMNSVRHVLTPISIVDELTKTIVFFPIPCKESAQCIHNTNKVNRRCSGVKLVKNKLKFSTYSSHLVWNHVYVAQHIIYQNYRYINHCSLVKKNIYCNY